MPVITSEELLKNPDLIKKSYEVEPNSLLQYPDKINSPNREMVKNVYDGLKYSVNYLGSGVTMKGSDVALGSNYFIESGKCNPETSSVKCKDKKKYTYVRNIPTGTIPPLNLSFYNATGCNLTGITEGRGLVPGLFEQLYDINPVELSRGAMAMGNLGSDECKEMTLPVGYGIYDESNIGSTWNWETKCTAGHNTMTETTNADLNYEIKSRNRHIKNARMPGPLQLRENFESEASTEPTKSGLTIILLLTGISALVTAKACKVL